jgi:ATP-binding cassette, subfamily C (CFTR/MRP), member 1
MSHPGDEKDMKELDPVGIVTNTTMHEDLVAESRDDSSEDEVAIALDPEKHPHTSKNMTTTELTRNDTSATGRTDVTEESDPPKKKKSWNPLKRNPPPIPETRGISGEYRAGFLSRLSFQWVTPMMSVSLPCSIR